MGLLKKLFGGGAAATHSRRAMLLAQGGFCEQAQLPLYVNEIFVGRNTAWVQTDLSKPIAKMEEDSIVFADSSWTLGISHRHAMLEWDPSARKYSLSNLSSRNAGIKVNGRPLARGLVRKLAEKDTFEVEGGYKFQILYS